MALITVISGRALLNIYEHSVEETHLDISVISRIQESLREIDHLAYGYLFEGDQSAQFRFKAIEEQVDMQFHQLAEAERQFGSNEHAHSKISLPVTNRAWQGVKAEMLNVFQNTPGTNEANTKALARVHAVVDPLYETISRYQKLSMQDMQTRLESAQFVGGRAFYAMLSAILIGLGLLIGMGLAVGRSVLRPITKLHEAAHKLVKKDFSHRVKLRNTRDELGQLGRVLNIASATFQRLHRELELRATHDGMTGLFNRASFDEQLPQECEIADRHKRSLALLMVDIDFFKRVNDEHGHQTGDRVLQAIARLLSETTRPGDVVTRYGGEEFAIILPQSGEDSAMAMAERLRSAIENAVINYGTGEDIKVTVSIGCASRQSHTVTAEDLVKAGDAALYRAKEAGRNRVISAGNLAPENDGIAQIIAA
uniref:GGDEF domain-containing protein n=1 Tax=Pararhizobium sp. IMCC3301 TaxID=3067904 RepID=UPI002740A465|nr:GGDEF domain-containing protein [Pararhizobium sp. IMCC3301]